MSFEKDAVDGINTNRRLALVDAEDWESVPDVMLWSFGGLKGQALLFFIAGHSPRCHRCRERGHRVLECGEVSKSDNRPATPQKVHLCSRLSASIFGPWGLVRLL